MKRRSIAILLLVSACADPSIDEYEPRSGVITGTVLVSAPSAEGEPNPCIPTPARGNVIVTVFEENNLPPPQGTSSPLTFIVVPADAFFPAGAGGEEGVFAAPFTIPSVPAGRYQVRAFLDADGDFHPTIPLLAQPTAGDIGGGFVDTETRQFLVLEVEEDKSTEQITVSVGQPFPVERPAFAITSTRSFDVPYATPQTMVIESRAIQRDRVTMKPMCTSFLVQYVDTDLDGTPDDTNGDHLPDLYPTVLLRQVEDPTIIIPAIIDPLPFQDALAAVPAVPTTRLELLLPPVAVKRTVEGLTVLPSVPAGSYETIVISGTGQTWQIPNDLDVIQPAGAPDATQSVLVEMQQGPDAPAGGISGMVQVAGDITGDVFVVAFSAQDPPPPAGTGTPRGLATVPAASFSGATAPFTIAGLAADTYTLVAIMDTNGNFSPLVSTLSQPDAGDVLGAGTAPVSVSGGVVLGQVVLVGQPLPFDRPAFSFDDGISIPRTAFPTTFQIRSHEVAALGIVGETATLPVSLTSNDEDGDNFVDLRPRVLLTLMADGDPRTAPNAARVTIIPGIVSPIPFLAPLVSGAPVIPSDALDIILPPVALVANASGGFDRVSPPPAGRYRVNVLSATGQTWSVPSDLDVALGRVGGPLEDPTQTRYVTVEAGDVPGGAITGRITLAVPPPADEFSVVVFAFAANAPPPPAGAGRPVAIAVVDKSSFDMSNTAPYALGGLPTGRYQVRAFLDANDDFVPWFDTLNQPNAGDVGGGHLDLMRGVLLDVDVNALAAPIADIDVTIIQPLAYATDRPAFEITPENVRLDPSTGSVTVTLRALSSTNDVLSASGVFPVMWVDLDGNGQADDINGDFNPDTFPIVVADQLDADDESNQTLAADAVRIPGFINPAQFVPNGFPAQDPTDVAAVALVMSVDVVFPGTGIRPSNPAQPITPPDGRYRVTVVGPNGQTWSTPNELAGATGTPLPMTQGRYLTVSD